MMLLRCATLLFVTVLATTAALAQAQGPEVSTPNRARAVEFLEQLKHAVDSVDPQAVSSMVAYPLTVLASGFNIPVKDASSFVRIYDSVFTPELRCAVVATEISPAGAPQSRRSLTITPDGLSMVDGAIWAPFKEGRYRLARIRVLPPAPSVEGRKSTERVTFAQAKGERSTTYAGWLVRQNVDAYVVTVRRGETVQAHIDGFRGHDAAVRLAARAPRPAGPPVPVPDTGRSSSVVAPADAEYLIEVAHLAHYCDPPQRYKLTVTIR